MAEPTLHKRPYHSTRRQESARLTRQAIARAALELFNRRGYNGASVDAIAGAAGVAPETIFATFGSKREILHYLVDISFGGDEAPVRVIDRPEQQAILHETDAHRLVSNFSEGVPRIMERAAPVFALLSEAAKTEPELAELQKRLHRERLENMNRIARAIADLAPLRIEAAEAADLIWALASPELFLLLTNTRGWSKEQVSAWLKTTLFRLLFQDIND